MAIVHTHAPALIPFGISKVPLKPVYHRSAFVAAGVPVFEIRERAGMTDMLIRDQALARALADALGNHPAALMRGHGAVIVGPSIQRVVGRSIFLPLNAALQMQAAALGGPVTYIDPQEAKKIEDREGYGLGRAWEAWKRKALAKP
jgi:HCOMODA/2-hydroxy-3-carboxy-muconic semialdehyde decarboxylase